MDSATGRYAIACTLYETLSLYRPIYQLRANVAFIEQDIMPHQLEFKSGGLLYLEAKRIYHGQSSTPMISVQACRRSSETRIATALHWIMETSFAVCRGSERRNTTFHYNCL